MCTGKRPFTGTVEELTQANLSEIPSLAAIESSMLRDFIDHLLVKDPQQRIESASLALALLNKTVKQSNQLTAHSTPHIAEKNYQAFMQVELAITETPTAIQCFHVDDSPLIALVYAHYVDIIDPLKPDVPFKSLLTAYPLQVLNNHLLAYATPSRIQILNLRDNKDVMIKEGLSDLKEWYVEHNRLVWNNSFHRFYETIDTDATIKYGKTNYLFGSKTNVLADGSFVTSEGMANDKIVLRDNQATFKYEWLLANPIIALTHYDDTLLVATMGLNESRAYTLWRLTTDQPTHQLVLADNINQLICINGLAFWLADKKILSYCNTSLQPETLNTFAFNALTFAVCYDHRFIVINDKDDKNRLFLTILKDRAAL